jgi:hypothetical protein
MADWVQQAQQMVERWTELQKDWLLTVTDAYGGAEAKRAESVEDARRKTLEVWQESVKHALEAQAEVVRLWAAAVESVPGVAEARRAQATQETVGRWIDGQRKLWDSWLALAQGAQPQAQARQRDWDEAGRRVLDSLQEATDKALQAQADWLRAVGAKS